MSISYSMRPQRDSNPYLAPWQGGIVTIQPRDQLTDFLYPLYIITNFYIGGYIFVNWPLNHTYSNSTLTALISRIKTAF